MHCAQPSSSWIGCRFDIAWGGYVVAITHVCAIRVRPWGCWTRASKRWRRWKESKLRKAASWLDEDTLVEESTSRRNGHVASCWCWSYTPSWFVISCLFETLGSLLPWSKIIITYWIETVSQRALWYQWCDMIRTPQPQHRL